MQGRAYLSRTLPIKNSLDKPLAEPIPNYTPTPYGAFISNVSLSVARWDPFIGPVRVLLGLCRTYRP
jgi:hypothetical protein